MADALLLVGCGGHGRVLLDAALAAGLPVSGIVDPGLVPGSLVYGVPVRGGDQYLDTAEAAGAGWLNGVGANPHLGRRRSLYEALSATHSTVAVRHPSVLCSRPGEMADGVQLMAGVVVQPGASIGANSVVNTGARVDHDCRIGAHCFVSPGAVLCGSVQLQDGVFVGAGAVLLPGVKVGSGAVIGAAALVNRDVPDRAVMVGSPARQIRLNG